MRVDLWTADEEAWLRTAVATEVEQGRTPQWSKWAPKLQRTAHALRFKWRRMQEPPDPPPTELPPPPLRSPSAFVNPPGTKRDIRDILDLPPRPFAVGAPFVARKKGGGLKTALWYSDVHVPHQDDRALAVVFALAELAQPDVVINGGDLLDCSTISSFDKDPNRKHNLQDEIDLARAHLAQMAAACPNAERWLLEGNHEDRLRRICWKMSGGEAELARLTGFRESLTWPKLLGLDELGWHWVPTHEQTKTEIIPRLITKHGTKVSKFSAYTAKAECQQYGKGGLSGHTHRLGAFYHRDHNGSVCWWESGCLCDLDPDYTVDPDWQQGCLVITWDEDDGWFGVEPVFIQDGTAIWRGHRLSA